MAQPCILDGPAAAALDPARWVCLEATVAAAELDSLGLRSAAAAAPTVTVLFPLPRAVALQCATIAALAADESPDDALRVPIPDTYPAGDIYLVALYARLATRTPEAALHVPLEHFPAALTAVERRLLSAAERQWSGLHPVRRLTRIAQLAEFLQFAPFATLLAGRVAWHMAHASSALEMRRMLWPEDVAPLLPLGPPCVNAALHCVPAEGAQSAAVVHAKVGQQRLLGGGRGAFFSNDAAERAVEELRLD